MQMKTLLAAVAAIFAVRCAAEVREVAFMTAARVDAPPAVDGSLDDAAWTHAEPNDRYYQYNDTEPDRVHYGTVCRIVYDERGIYVGICNPETQIGNLKQKVRNDNDQNIWMDDCAEIHFDPAAKAEGYYKYSVNSLGKMATTWCMDAANFHEDWISPGARVAAKVFPDRWEIELFVPWGDMKLAGQPQPGTTWLFSHNRFRFMDGGRQHSTTSPGGMYQTVDHFTYLQFRDGAPPDANAVLAEVCRRAKPPWAMEICGRTYVCEDGTVRESAETVAMLRARLAKKKAAREAKAAEDLARVFDGRPVDPLTLPLAGTYDFARPAGYDGFNGFYRHNPDVGKCVAERHEWKTDGSFAPRVLFITGFGQSMRDAVEVSARFPVDAGYFPGNFGAGGIYEIGVSLGTALDKERQFESLLAHNPDIVVFDDFHCGYMPIAYKAELLRRVRDNGVGIVFLTNGYQFNDAFSAGRALKAEKPGERVVSFGRGRLVDATRTAQREEWTVCWRASYERRAVYVWNLMRRAKGLPADVGMEREAEALVAAEADFGGLTLDGGDIVPEDGSLDVRAALASAAPDGAELLVDVASSPYGDIWRRESVALKGGSSGASFTLKDGDVPTLAAVVDARVVSGGRTFARARRLYHYPNHRFDDYTLVSWDGLNYGRLSGAASAFLAPLLVDEFGYRSALGAIGCKSAVFNQRAVPYRCRVNLVKASNGGVKWPGLVAFAKQHAEDKKAAAELDDEANPYDPRVKALLESYFGKEVDSEVPYGVSLWDLGDECGASYEAGHGPMDVRPFAEFLKSKYGTIENLNAMRSSSYRDFGEVPHLKVQEALERGDWPAWLDHIEYMDKMYADAFRMFADVIRRRDPRARIGAEGSEPGDLEQTVDGLDFWGPYRNLVADETLRNVRPDAVRGIWWGGYIQCTRSGYPLEQWEYLLTGTVNADLWFQCEPGGTLSAFGGDLNFAPYVERMLPHLKRLRRGVAQLLIRTPFRNDGFAFYRSQLSLRAAQLGCGFRSPDASIAPLIRNAYRTGRNVRILTTGTRDGMRDVRVLLLCGATALRDDEVDDLRAFARRGGTILADCEPGVLDRYFVRRKSPPLEGLWRQLPDPEDAKAVDAVLAACGIGANPESVLGPDADETIFRVRQDGDMRIVGLKTTDRSLGRQVCISFGKPGFVYEVDVGFVGVADKVEIPSLDVPFKLYSVFGKRQKQPTAEWRDGAVSTKGLRTGSVYRLTPVDPKGRALEYREDVFAADGRPRPFRFAHSDAKGSWTLRLRDVATGQEISIPVFNH